MKKSYTLKYEETFEHYHSEYHEEEYSTREEVFEALRNLTFSFNVRNVQVSENTVFEDFYVEMWQLGLDK